MLGRSVRSRPKYTTDEVTPGCGRDDEGLLLPMVNLEVEAIHDRLGSAP
jgi:hypothetical protein